MLRQASRSLWRAGARRGFNSSAAVWQEASLSEQSKEVCQLDPQNQYKF